MVLVGDHDLYPKILGLCFHQRRASRFGLCYPAVPQEEARTPCRSKYFWHFTFKENKMFFNSDMFLFSLKSGSKSHINGKGQSYSAIPKNSSKVNISDEVARSGAWLHVNQSKASFQE
jgi:hypothetical protein